MKLNTPFLLFFILFSFTLNGFAECISPGNISSNKSFTESCYLSYGSDETYKAKSENRTLTINSGTTVHIDMDGNTLILSGDDWSGDIYCGVEIIVKNGAAFSVNGNLELKNYSKITIEDGGIFILKGNLIIGDASDVNLSMNSSLNIAESAAFHINGNAAINFASGAFNNNLYASGSVSTSSVDGAALQDRVDELTAIKVDLEGWYSVPFFGLFVKWINNNRVIPEIAKVQTIIDSGDFEEYQIDNSGETLVGNRIDPDGPFSSTLSITYSSNNHQADFFKSDSVSAHSDFDSDEIATTIMTGIRVSAATGWFGKEIRVASSEGFTSNELKVNELNGKVIYSLKDLEDALHSIKWQIKNNDVKKELAKYHKNSQNKDKIDPEKISAIQTYFDTERKIKLEFVAEGSSAGRKRDLSSSNQRVLSIPEVTITSNSEDLPVTLVSFEAFTLEDNSVALEWTTATEVNNSHFEIWRSTDTKNWNLLSKIESEGGNSNYAIDYAYVDEYPLNVAYYKLIQYDFDGVNESFGPLKVTSLYKQEKMMTKVYPNNISSSAKATNIVINGLMSYQREIEIQLYDQHGNILKEEHLIDIEAEAYLYQLSLPNNLTTGMYYVVISSGSERTKNKVIVN
ncbi:T9SS type A sorting domain-containing protein [Flammeovirga pectinis]|uniref:T9SS type A sorting domain-containing protein n=1 Tax=Flammeovirga pectinis TaxID=2494373 RepID=A0A3Q9FPN1_9BACT|nr:T9SS type A sorting domain-containing protein [Flammeovirga pectinis]AZQ63487.1 T9SS type A sorting domain-containing protein [Flammeovirga pectinis]